MFRVNLNYLYAVVLLLIVYLVFIKVIDKPIETGTHLEAVVKIIKPIAPGVSYDHSAYIHIISENDIELVKRVSNANDLEIGQKISLKVFKTRFRGVVSYQAIY